MLWVFAIGYITYWSVRLTRGRRFSSGRRKFAVRALTLVAALVTVIVHWFVVGAAVDAIWPGLGYDGAEAVLAEAGVIASGALIWGCLVPRFVCARLGASSRSAPGPAPDDAGTRAGRG